MTRNAKNSASPVAAIEIRHSTLAMALLEPAGPDGTSRVRTRLVRWRHEANSLPSEQGVRELTKALKALVAEEKLAAAKVGLTLGGDYCVTRVVTGDTEHVRRELALLEKRSELYLSLGAGRKSTATSIHELDARHQHALMAVTSSKTLDAVLKVGAAAGLEVDLVEPSLVSLCRLSGYQGLDADEPVLMIGLGGGGVELGISYRGQLLLDYRPGGRSAQEDVVDIVLRHLARLRRYCDRYYRHARGRLTRVVLCGATEAVEKAVASFRQQDELTVEVFDPAAPIRQLDGRQWRFTAAGPGAAACCAALGTCVRSTAADPSSAGPNFMAEIRSGSSRPLGAELCRTFWPVAAAMLMAVGLLAATWYEQVHCSRLAVNIEQLDSSAAELWTLRRRTAEIETKSAHLQALADAVSGAWRETMLSTVARCMPEEIWLDRITIDSQGKVTLTGNSYLEATIYQFVDYLKRSPGWSYVALEGTWPASTRSGRTTKFDIQCEFDARTDDNEKLSHYD